MLTSCVSCGRLIQLGSSSRCKPCKTNKARPYEQARAQQPHRTNRQYATAGWRQARKIALDRADHACTTCGTSADLVVHHIVSVTNGGSLTDQANLMVVCRVHHQRLEAQHKREQSQ